MTQVAVSQLNLHDREPDRLALVIRATGCGVYGVVWWWSIGSAAGTVAKSYYLHHTLQCRMGIGFLQRLQ